MPTSEPDGARQTPHAGVFQSIFKHAPIGIALFSRSGNTLYANAAFKALAGANDGSASVSIESLVHPDDLPEVREAIGELGVVGDATTTLQARFAPAVREGWFRLNASAIGRDAGRTGFVVAFFEDITEQVAAERRLIGARDEAEKATRIKSDFLANMSHEIRTPIHTIIGMTELLNETRLDPEQSEYASQVGFSADVLLSLINDILDFSKIEAGKLSLEEIVFDLHETVEDAVDLVALEAHKKGLEVVVSIAPDVPRSITGDPVRLRQVIVNLFNNAMKFTSEGEIAISVSSRPETPGSVVRVEVQDTGIGIPPEKVSRLFKEFSQVDSSTTRKYGGSGLGLSISKNLVDMMGGEIGVESEEGRGSIFWFTLPVSTAEPGEAAVSPGVAEGLEAYQRALIVDDNRTARRAQAAYVREFGLQVAEAQSADEALEMLRTQAEADEPFDICLIDLIMPRIDGWHLASVINSDPAIAPTHLFLMSPAGKSGDEAKMKLLGWFDGYLTKPVKRAHLRTAFARALSDAVELEPVDAGDVEELAMVGGADGEAETAITGRVLVAEDHEVNQHLFRTILESLGLEVVLAGNGREAAEAVDAKTRLVFMDVQMPEMNGYEATKRIRDAGFDVPIIAVTASAIKGERERALESGMSDFLTKPFKKRDLVPILTRWLRPSEHTVEGGVCDTGSEVQSEQIDQAEIFDLDSAVETFLGNRETVLKLLGPLTERATGGIDGIRKAIETGDTDAIRQEAHAIKGSSLNLSVRRLGQAAAELETSAKDADLEACRALFDRVVEEFERFSDYSRKLTES